MLFIFAFRRLTQIYSDLPRLSTEVDTLTNIPFLTRVFFSIAKRVAFIAQFCVSFVFDVVMFIIAGHVSLGVKTILYMPQKQVLFT